MKTLIRGAQCVFPDGIRDANVILENSKIVDIDAPQTASADEVIDAAGLHLMPGVIDDQVHFRDPGLTHKEDLHTGSLGCAKGGVTTFLEMPNTKPPAITQQGIDEKLAIAASKSVVNYGFYIGATPNNVAHLQTAERVPGIKIFIGSSTGDLLVDEQEALERIFAESTLPICAHCEDETTVNANTARLKGGKSYAEHSQIRDHLAARIATKRAIDLAHKYNHRFHVLHVSTADELPLISDHRGLITAEVCPHHVFFNVDDYERLGSLVQMNPSIKNAEDNKGLWAALLDNTIQVIATDHAPHTKEEKDQPYPKSPSGLPAVENVLALMLNEVNAGRLSLERLVEAMCDAPARVWDIVDKGRLAVGYDADVVLVDLNKTQTIDNDEQLTKSRWSPWHGDTLTGWAVRTIVMGKTVFRDGQVDREHRGQPATYDHARGGYWA
jgi:dihydroorotase